MDLRAAARMSIPPALAVEVPRGHVDRLLQEASRRPLTVVTAGPGWGKTTTVAGWARRVRESGAEAIVWLGLTPADASPAAFWDAVLHAVKDSSLVPDDHDLMFVSTSGGVNEEVLRALFRGLDTLPSPVLLVLDDFHVIGDDEVMSALVDLVTLQSNVRIMVLTRFDPPLPLHRLRVAGALAEVSASDLAFDADAVRMLAAGAESLDLDRAVLDVVLDRTEGWPTGVRLATMYLAREGTGHGLDGFGGTDKSVAEYLVAEVLLRNTDEVRDFLLRTSVAEWITGDLADAMVPGGHGRARLEALERTNQFVVSVNPDRTVYRYHPLLRDLLVYTLHRDNPEGFRGAHRAAASWLMAHRYPIIAMQHAIAAEDWPLAIEAFVEASPSLVGALRSALVEQLRAIPYSSLEPTAALELCAAALEFGTGHFAGMDSHVTEVRRLLAAGDALSPVAMALLENLATAAARARGDEASVALMSGAALMQVSQAAPGPAADGNRAIATTQSAVGLLRSGDSTAARVLLARVARDDSGADVDLMVLGSRGHLAWCDLVDGDLDGATFRARQVIEAAALRGWTSQMQARFSYLPLAVAELLRGDAESADRTVAAGLAAVANGIEVWPTIGLHLAQASVAVSRDRPRAATAALESARSALGDWPVSPALADTWTRVAAEVAILSGSFDDRPHSLPGEAEASPTVWSACARVALARGDLDSALAAAGHVSKARETPRLDNVLAAIEAAIVEALVARRQGRTGAATHAMGEALSLAAGAHIIRPFLITGSPVMADLVAASPATPDTGAVRDAILSALGPEGSEPGPEPEPLVEPLTERELAVLVELPSMRTNEEIAKDFYVSINTVKSHLKHTYRKLGVTNRRDAVRRARALGLLP